MCPCFCELTCMCVTMYGGLSSCWDKLWQVSQLGNRAAAMSWHGHDVCCQREQSYTHKARPISWPRLSNSPQSHVCLFCVSVHLHARLSIFLSICQPVFLTLGVFLSFISILSIYLSTCRIFTVFVKVCLFSCLSVYLYAPAGYLYECMCVYIFLPPACLPICLSV